MSAWEVAKIVGLVLFFVGVGVLLERRRCP